MDAVSIRVPYKNLRQEVELVGVDESELRRLQTHSFNSSSSPSRISDSGETPPDSNQSRNVEPPKNCSLITLILSCTVAAGVQFGWALQLSLLTPYIQTLGIGHAFASFIWLCGPITGLVVQPFVGIWSDKCSSKYGRRRPFIFVGSLMISVAVIIIGFSADIGYLLGDTKEHCSTFKGTRSRAAIIFIIGFWMLDLANNTVQVYSKRANLCAPTWWKILVFVSSSIIFNIINREVTSELLQGPARALLADLSGNPSLPTESDEK